MILSLQTGLSSCWEHPKLVCRRHDTEFRVNDQALELESVLGRSSKRQVDSSSRPTRVMLSPQLLSTARILQVSETQLPALRSTTDTDLNDGFHRRLCHQPQHENPNLQSA